MNEKIRIGQVIGASLSNGIFVQLSRSSFVEEIPSNSLVVIQGDKRKYLGLIADISLIKGTNHASKLANIESRFPSDKSRNLTKNTKELFSSYGVFSSAIHIIPLSQTTKNSTEDVDTIPSYLSAVSPATKDDVEIFYGKVDNRLNWGIGFVKSSLKESEENILIPINLDVLVRGSFGIFGKAGTGKTMLGNIISGLIILGNKTKSFEKEVKLLIFDMHSEYGLKLKDQHGRDYEDGVGRIFKKDFLILSPDHTLAEEYGLEKFEIKIENITEEYIINVKEVFDLSDAFINYLYDYKAIYNEIFEKIAKKYGINIDLKNPWIHYLFDDLPLLKDNKKTLEEIEREFKTAIREKISPGAIYALSSGKSKLKYLSRVDFISKNSGEDSVKKIINELFDGNRSVIISMGRYGDDLRAYTFIANIISMKIWNTAVNRIMKGEELKYKIIIFLEEAHKFLSPEGYYKNPFGDIARELRKRGILLCIIDQRPSQIAEDVIAMLWNNFVFSLTEAKDITSVTRNLKFSSLFESVISNLKRREALIFGEMIKIPAVVTIVDYKEMVKFLKRVYENQKTLVEIPGY